MLKYKRVPPAHFKKLVMLGIAINTLEVIEDRESYAPGDLFSPIADKQFIPTNMVFIVLMPSDGINHMVVYMTLDGGTHVRKLDEFLQVYVRVEANIHLPEPFNK